MPARPRILFISSCWPLGRAFGGQLRALHTARSLQDVGDVTLMVVGSEAASADAALLSASEFRVVPPAAPTLQPNKTAWERFRWAVDVEYLNVHGCVVSPADRARVLSYFPQYDLIWVLNARTPNLLQIWEWPHSHLDLDDIPSSYLARVADTAEAPAQRWKAQTQRVLLHRRERHFHERFTTLSVCSEADRAYLQSDRAHVIPNGFPRPRSIAPRRAVSPPRLGFIGLYSYAPNLEGMRWFFSEVWPQIRQTIPGIRFRLAGRDTDGRLKPDAPDVDVLGWLDDPADEIASWSAMVVPIRVGGGTRIKIVDAFSRQCPVVSTRFGAYGYPVHSGRHLLLADEPRAFADACIDLVRHPEFARELAATAWQAFLDQWTWEAVAPRVHAAAEDCLRRSHQPVPA